MSTKLRLIFGGTFNPLHRGHTACLEAVSDLLEAHSVHFVLSARPPHKDEVSASIRDRYVMLELGLADYAHFYADDTEIRRSSLSYTKDTVEAFKERFPNSQLCLVIGADSLSRLHTWHLIDEWVDEINWIVLARPGYTTEAAPELNARVVRSHDTLRSSKGGAIWIFEGSNFDISSTAIRQLIASADDSSLAKIKLNDYLAPQVRDYIQTNTLYSL